MMLPDSEVGRKQCVWFRRRVLSQERALPGWTVPASSSDESFSVQRGGLRGLPRGLRAWFRGQLLPCVCCVGPSPWGNARTCGRGRGRAMGGPGPWSGRSTLGRAGGERTASGPSTRGSARLCDRGAGGGADVGRAVGWRLWIRRRGETARTCWGPGLVSGS